MKLTELISRLNEVLKEHGELDVFFYDEVEERTAEVTGRIWTGIASDADDEFYNAGDSDIYLNEIANDVPVLVLR